MIRVRTEAQARAVNAKPWQPLPGMVKCQCVSCRYWHATPEAAPASMCADCAQVFATTGRLYRQKVNTVVKTKTEE